MVEFLTEDHAAFLETQRIKHAIQHLNSGGLINYLALQTIIFNHDLPESVRWARDTEWGSTNIYYTFEEAEDQQCDSYFASEDEFRKATDEAEHLRNYAIEIDSQEFTFDSSQYSVVRISKDGLVAFAGNTEENGDFYVDVYPNIQTKRNILVAAIQRGQNRIDQKQNEIAEIQTRNDRLQMQLDQIPTL